MQLYRLNFLYIYFMSLPADVVSINKSIREIRKDFAMDKEIEETGKELYGK
jgi:hypothetical protein